MELTWATRPPFIKVIGNIKLIGSYDNKDPCIICNDAQLHQMILNVAANAVHAISDAVRWSMLDLWIRMTISDTGAG